MILRLESCWGVGGIPPWKNSETRYCPGLEILFIGSLSLSGTVGNFILFGVDGGEGS